MTCRSATALALAVLAWPAPAIAQPGGTIIFGFSTYGRSAAPTSESNPGPVVTTFQINGNINQLGIRVGGTTGWPGTRGSGRPAPTPSPTGAPSPGPATIPVPPRPTTGTENGTAGGPVHRHIYRDHFGH